MSLNKKIKDKSDKSLNIPDSDSPLLDHIKKQQLIKDSRVIDPKEKEQMIQDEQIRIDNDIKGCYITFNFMFYGLIILMLIPLTFFFRGFTLEEVLNFYGMYAVFGRNIVIIPLAVMAWMWLTARKRDSYHPSTIKMKKMFRAILIVTIILVIISLIVFGNGLKDLNF